MEIQNIEEHLNIPGLPEVIKGIRKEFGKEYDLEQLYDRMGAFLSPGHSDNDTLSALTKAAAELTTQEAPRWEMIAARFRMLEFGQELQKTMAKYHLDTFYEESSLYVFGA